MYEALDPEQQNEANAAQIGGLPVSCKRAVRVAVSLWAASSRLIGKPYQASVMPHRLSDDAARTMEPLHYTVCREVSWLGIIHEHSQLIACCRS